MWQPADWFDDFGPEDSGFAEGFYDEHGNLIGVFGEPGAGASEFSTGFSTGFSEGSFDPPDDWDWTIPDDPEDPGEDPGEGGAGVREPRRPLPGAPFTAAEADPDEST